MPNKWLFFALFLKMGFVNVFVSCDCGRPHRPAFGRHDGKQNQRFKEDRVINYYCNQSFRLIFDEQRVCKFGVWSGRPAICAKPITTDVSLEKVVIFSDRTRVFNISANFDDIYVWKSEDKKKCITSDTSNQQNWTLILSKPKVINYFVLKLRNNPFRNDSNVLQNVKSILINTKEVKLKRHPKTCSLLKFNTNNELEFICNSVPKLKTQIDENDRSDEILLNFTNLSDLLSICGLSIYRFPNGCGKISLSLEMNVEEVEEDLELEASCSDGFELIGNSRIRCAFDGQWSGSPTCKPLNTCQLIDPSNKFDPNVARIEYRNGFYFNKTLMAINETDAIHYCLKNNTINNRNKSFSRHVLKYIRQCENGVWSEVDTDCDTLLIDDPSVESTLNGSNYFSIILTMVVMIIMFSFLSVGSYSVLKYKSRRKMNANERISLNAKKVMENTRKYTNNRLSDPFDDSVYSMVAEDSYDIINFDSNRLHVSQYGQYDDTEVPKPYYLEILPLNEQSSVGGSIQSFP